MKGLVCSVLSLIFAALLCAASAGLAAPVPAAAAPPTGYDPLAMFAAGQVRLEAPERGMADRFGSALAATDDTIVVGAALRNAGDADDQGAVYVYVRTGSGWRLQQQLMASDGQAGDNFGWAVAISGDTLVVGAFYDDIDGAVDRGSAYVFTRSGATWTQRQKLTASDGAAGDQFGGSLALAVDTLVVGAFADDVGSAVDQGSAYVFTRSAGVWTERASLLAADGAESDFFGGVALSGDTALIASYADDVGGVSDKGSVYVFTGSGADWEQQAHLSPVDGGASENFGTGIALWGDTAVIGSIYDHIEGRDAQGSAYVLTRSGAEWTQQAKLVSGDGAAGDYFSGGLALCADLLLSAAPNADTDGASDRGALYAFSRRAGVWGQWKKLVSSDGEEGDRFGSPVVLCGTAAVVGAWADDGERGAVYVVGLGPGRPAPKAPKGFIRGRTPIVRWAVATDAVSYEVRVLKGGKVLRQKSGITATSWKCSQRLPRAVWLTWRVRARNAAGAGAWSAALRFRVR